MNESETRAYISNIENGRMNPTLYGELVESISTLEKIAGFTKKLSKQMSEEKKLDEEIKKQLKNMGVKLE
ncbi:MAG: hypothetical protein AAB946_01590 [Patescibacteria group bacterium]